MKLRFYLATLVLLVLPGCIDDIPSGVLLERPRVLGARVVIDGEPERASPRPGEAATLRIYTASNDGTGWASALTACVAAPAFMGIPGCAGDPFAFSLPGAPSVEPEIAFTVPGPEAFVGGSSSILFAGVLCANGTPSAQLDEAMLPTCDGEDPVREIITFSLPIAVGMAPANRHPSIVDETITIDEMVWEAPMDPPATGCAGAPMSGSLPRIAVRDEEDPSRLVFTSDPADREPYQELVLGEEMPRLVDSREELEITHLASAGRFERLLTIVFDDDAPDPAVEWEHPLPEDVPADGLTVRFHFIVRDRRGGMDWTERAACLVP